MDMDGWEILKQAAGLERRGQAFALATVVWRQGPSSSQQGARAIITGEGELQGWIGGAGAGTAGGPQAPRGGAPRPPPPPLPRRPRPIRPAPPRRAPPV